MAGWPAQLTASTDNCMRLYSYAELAVFFPSGSRNHR